MSCPVRWKASRSSRWGSGWRGHRAAAILCDWGADVVKIEPPNGDPFRGLFASALGAAVPINPPFEIDNRGKRSICLNLENAQGGR